MKIVFLSPAAQGGGAEEVLFDLIAGLKTVRPAWELHVISGESGPLLERLRRLGVEAEVLAFPSSFRAYGEQPAAPGVPRGGLSRLWVACRAGAEFLIYVSRLKRRLRRLSPHILHSNGMKMHLAAAFSRNRGTSLVWHLHDYLSTRQITSRLLPRFSSGVRLVLANSRSVAQDAATVLRRSRIEVLENSVDLDRFRPEGPVLDLDRLSGLDAAPAETIRVGLVATFARWKGQDIFLRAMALLPENLPVRFYIVGGPVYATPGSQWTREELAGLAAPVTNRVGFTGWVDDVPAALRSLDIVVHASVKPEPFGLVIIQAMACGRAVIVSGEGGAAEVVGGEPEAMTFTPRDAKSLAETLLLLIGHPKERTAAALNGLAIVRRRFSRERFAAQVADYFGSLVPDAA